MSFIQKEWKREENGLTGRGDCDYCGDSMDPVGKPYRPSPKDPPLQDYECNNYDCPGTRGVTCAECGDDTHPEEVFEGMRFCTDSKQWYCLACAEEAVRGDHRVA